MGNRGLILLILAVTTTTTTKTTAAAAATTTASSSQNCRDHERPGGLTCADLPRICTTDPLLAHLLCPSYCDHCDVYDEWKDLLLKDDIPCKDIAEGTACKDFKANQGDCSSPLAKALCKQTCNRVTSNSPCSDHTKHLACEDIPGVCNTASGVLLCPKYCHLCDASLMVKLQSEDTCPAQCTDLISPDDCLQPGICQDSELALQLCAFTCFNCQPPSTTTPTTTTPTTTTTTPTTTTTTPTTTTTTPTTTTTTPTTTTTTPTTTTTTPTTTTTTPTTTTTTPTTTTTTPNITPAPRPGSECVVCGDPATNTPCSPLDLVLGDSQRCPDTTPYCMNDISQANIGGVTQLTQYKRCVDETDCRQLWFEGSSDIKLCKEFQPGSSTDDVDCHLCCYGDMCNLSDVPPPNTWYHP